MEVEILLDGVTECVTRPLTGNEGERLFPKTAQLQEKPAKDQGKTSQGPGKDQTKTSEKPLWKGAETAPKTSIEKAREHLPEPKHLLDEIMEKWFLIEALQQDVYGTSEQNGFCELFTQIKSGSIKVCPRPIVNNLNEKFQTDVSRNTVTRTLNLYIEYTEEYRQPRIWTLVFRGLDRIDTLLEKAVNF